MKATLLFLCIWVMSFMSFGQSDTIAPADTNMYQITTNDGNVVLGKILKKDAREVLILTSDGREVYIPQYIIKKIELVKPEDYNFQGEFVGEDQFATRYFISTNGLPLKKGEHYMMWNLFGPDFQFGVRENFGVGLMTSWIGVPIIGSLKFSHQFNDNVHMGIGALLGTTGLSFTWGFNAGGALPFATLSFGNRRANLALSGGYGALFFDGDVEGRTLLSISAMAKVGKKVSLVFESFMAPPGPLKTNTSTYNQWNQTTGMYEEVTYTYSYRQGGFALIILGARINTGSNSAFQFGFANLGLWEADYFEFIPFPIPMVSWFRSL